MENILSLKCLVCGKQYRPDEVYYVCPDHGDDGVLDVQYDYNFIGRQISRKSLLHANDLTIWRYKPMLPVHPDAKVPPLSVGWTPLYPAHRLASKLGLKTVWVKDDGLQPTASFKDRASAVAVVKAMEEGARIITTASTGNAAAALSGICASVGQTNVIFVPQSAPQAKIAQLLVFGSRVILVKGTYDDAFELCLQASKEYGWYNRNTGYNPYMCEGKKTAAYEICEQLDWDAPDRIFVSVGDGCIIGGLHKGLKDLMALGWIDKPPINARTLADSISAGLPRDRIKALTAVKETNGAYISISDDDILRAIPELARGTGVFAEAAGAAAYAGLVTAVDQGLVSGDEKIVVLNTGNGLKDVSGAMQALDLVRTKPFRVRPDLAELRQVAAGWGNE